MRFYLHGFLPARCREQMPCLCTADIVCGKHKQSSETWCRHTELRFNAGEEGRFAPGSFDSLSAVELSNGLGAALGLELPGTIAFDYPTLVTASASALRFGFAADIELQALTI